MIDESHPMQSCHRLSWVERRFGSAITANERRLEHSHLRKIDQDYASQGMYRSGGRATAVGVAKAEWAAFRVRRRATAVFALVSAVVAALAFTYDQTAFGMASAFLSATGGAANLFGNTGRPGE